MIGGTPASVHQAAVSLGRVGSAVGTVAESVGSHGESVTAQWLGEASAAAGESIHSIKSATYDVADAIGDCERVYATYADELAAAQSAWQAGNSQEVAGAAAVDAAGTASTAAGRRPADDPGRAAALVVALASGTAATAVQEAGRTAMAGAAAREARANEVAARAIDAVCDRLDDVVVDRGGGSARSDVSTLTTELPAGEWPWDVQQVPGAALGGLASADLSGAAGGQLERTQEYYRSHPLQRDLLYLELGMIAAGGLLVLADGTVVVLSVPLAATGVGAPVSVVADVIAVPLGAMGAGIMVAGAAGLLLNAGIMLYETNSSDWPADDPDEYEEPSEEAQKIAGGHAWDDHWEDFPDVYTKDQFAEVIDEVIEEGERIPMGRGRAGYWKDGVVVTVDPMHPDNGSAFKPDDGYDYFVRNFKKKAGR